MKEKLKRLSVCLCAMLMALLMVQCGPSWKDADKKIEEGDKAGAAEILTKLAENGDSDAINWLSEYYLEVISNSEGSDEAKLQIVKKAEPWFLKVANDREEPDMARILAVYYKLEKNDTESLKWNEIAAQKGDMQSAFELAEMYANPNSGIHDMKKAVAYYQKASDKGLPEATYALYEMYRNGNGLPKDEAKADQLLKKAAEQGSEYAKYIMAPAYLTGDGVPVDVTKAYEYIMAVPENLVLDKEMRNSIVRAYEAEQKMAEAKRAMAELKNIENILSGGTSWSYKDGSGISYIIRFVGNMTLVFERSDLYDKAANYAVSFKYSVDKDFAETLSPILMFKRYVDYKGVSADWILENFNGEQAWIRLSVSGETMQVSGNRIMAGTYKQMTR